eukprot:TRINITY_DN982_c0_g1_i5.p1 TRINITY_DN982_c0_g1~~TRINITY_DN982_c0_g1_i5.p1  ORF type:complete len:252 (+),score=37.27 TRINITY_DN982_c0_g1_i5:472-1227(+)
MNHSSLMNHSSPNHRQHSSYHSSPMNHSASLNRSSPMNRTLETPHAEELHALWCSRPISGFAPTHFDTGEDFPHGNRGRDNDDHDGNDDGNGDGSEGHGHGDGGFDDQRNFDMRTLSAARTTEEPPHPFAPSPFRPPMPSSPPPRTLATQPQIHSHSHSHTAPLPTITRPVGVVLPPRTPHKAMFAPMDYRGRIPPRGGASSDGYVFESTSIPPIHHTLRTARIATPSNTHKHAPSPFRTESMLCTLGFRC